SPRASPACGTSPATSPPASGGPSGPPAAPADRPLAAFRHPRPAGRYSPVAHLHVISVLQLYEPMAALTTPPAAGPTSSRPHAYPGRLLPRGLRLRPARRRPLRGRHDLPARGRERRRAGEGRRRADRGGRGPGRPRLA